MFRLSGKEMETIKKKVEIIETKRTSPVRSIENAQKLDLLAYTLARQVRLSLSYFDMLTESKLNFFLVFIYYFVYSGH